MNNKLSMKKMVTSAICLALCLVLPFLTGQIPQIGSMLSPMHIPVLLCGFLCGPLWGAVVGITAPLLRSVLFGMPRLFPTAIAMCFELCAYGFFAGFLYRRMPKKPWRVYAALICAMILGRLVWGAAQFVLLNASGSAFTLQAFMAGALFNAVPGIILHIVLIPILVKAVEKAGYGDNQ